jgi:hypothetical protein
VEDHRPAKIKFDFERCGRRVREGPCFVCAMLAGIDAAAQATLAQTILTPASCVKGSDKALIGGQPPAQSTVPAYLRPAD